jgi:ZIP family zinc transporter
MAFADLTLGALAAMLATTLGALLVFGYRRISGLTHSAMLALAAGVMAYSAIEMLAQAHGAGGDFAVGAGFALGLAMIFALERTLPHIHMVVRRREIEHTKKKAALLAGTVTIHNIPEGFAIASAFASSTPLGWLVAASMSLQDVPEGFLVAAPLTYYGVQPSRAIKFGFLSGFVEFVAAMAGYALLSAVSAFVPGALAFSAGAMAYVVFVELLPDAFREGDKRIAALCFMLGAAAAFGLAALLGF